MLTNPPSVDNYTEQNWRSWAERSLRELGDEITLMRHSFHDRLNQVMLAMQRDLQANPKALDAIPETARVVAGFAMEDMEERK
jgi:hypothetical protein